MAEQLALHQLGRDGPAVHRHEGPGASAALVQQARHQLLARSRLALDQHGRRGRRDAIHQRPHRPDRGTGTDHLDRRLCRRGGAPQARARRRRIRLQLAGQRVLEGAGVDGQRQAAVGARPPGSRFQSRVRGAGHEDQLPWLRGLAQHRDPVEHRVVGRRSLHDDAVEVAPRQQPLGLLRRVRPLDQRELPRQRPPHTLVAAGHGASHQQRKLVGTQAKVLETVPPPAGNPQAKSCDRMAQAGKDRVNMSQFRGGIGEPGGPCRTPPRVRRSLAARNATDHHPGAPEPRIRRHA